MFQLLDILKGEGKNEMEYWFLRIQSSLGVDKLGCFYWLGNKKILYLFICQLCNENLIGMEFKRVIDKSQRVKDLGKWSVQKKKWNVFGIFKVIMSLQKLVIF